MKELVSELDAVDGLQTYLFNKGIRTQSFELLSGGYTSTVYRISINGENAIVKHARFREKYYPTYQKLPETRIKTEVDVLNRLHPLFPNEVPEVLDYYPENDVMIMTDVGHDAQLGFPYLLEGRAEPIHAKALGNFLGRLKQATADWEPFPTVEDSFEQMWIRGLETATANSDWGKQWQTYYLKQKKFVWPDGHPKNVLFGNSGNPVRAIDFDCSHFADPDYMLPNFIGQLPIFSIMGYITPMQATHFVKEMIKGYTEVESITPETEAKMLFYAGTQTIQRQDGKWLFDIGQATDIESLKKKAEIFYFGRMTLSHIKSFDQYIHELGNITI